jgi:2-oxoisovalerate dehydrogenase E1 component
MTDADLPRPDLLELFRRMVRIREFEQAAFDLYQAGELPGFMHISIGQEATSVGSCAALAPGDHVTSTHRGHGDTIARGLSVEGAMAELFGRVGGICGAKGGSMHIADFGLGILGANGIVAAGMPIAVGAALSSKYLDRGSVALCFFGDGALASGPMHESLNMATLWSLPIVFVRQNNLYAESTPLADYQGIPDVVAWAASYGAAAERVDGNDVEAVLDVVGAGVDRARSGGGASFVECETYRWFGHNIGDPGKGRPPEEVERWKQRDPIVIARQRLDEHGLGPSADDAAAAERRRVEAAVEAARQAPPPQVEQAIEHVYTDPVIAAQALGRVDR